jgi:hypothetical protein
MYLNLEQQAKLAFNHAKSSELQAIKEEQLAASLSKQGGNAASSAELIQQYALAAQSHALAAQKNAPNSMQEYILVGVERQQELNLHLEAIREYVKLVKNRSSWWQEFSETASK